MKKLLLFLVSVICFSFFIPAQAENTSSSTVDYTCIKSAIEKREASIISAFDVYASTMKNALSVRAGSFSSSWNGSDKKTIRTSIKNVWNVFIKSRVAAMSAWRDARKAAWKQFDIDRKACKTESVSADINNSKMDSSY